MFSSGEYSNFPQSAAACGLPTTSSGSIDWAFVAAQWIQQTQMRDYSGAAANPNIPDAPPPPKISGNFDNNQVVQKRNAKNTQVSKNAKKKYEEKGEADMEMDDDEDNARSGAQNQMSAYCNRVPPAPSMQPNWFIQQPIGSMGPGLDISADAQQQNAEAQWNAWPPRSMLSTAVVNSNVGPTSSTGNRSTAHIPSLMKINIPDPNIKSMPENINENNSSTTMDAAKRKILPAWIREGLEKMEREKQRQLERQQKKSTAVSDDDSNSQTATDTPPLTGAHMVKNKIRSTLESDSSGNEEDDNERTVANTAASSIEKTKSATQTFNDTQDEDYQTEQAVVDAVKTGKSYEHKLSDLMIVVRKTLTELLLEVTNEEICSIANEAIKSFKNKATSAQLFPKSAISTITGKLGLAAYDDSSDESSGSDSEDSNKHENHDDSEEEIKANLRLKRKAFAKTSEEIEERIAESALREEQKLKFYIEQEQHMQAEEQKLKNQQERDNSSSSSLNYKVSGRGLGSTTVFASGKGYEKEFGETPDSKLQFSNGKRQKERTTRFSDIKDLKNAPIKAADYISQFKNSQIETAAQKINTALSQLPIDGPTSSTSSTKLDALPPLNAMLGVKRELNAESGSKHKPSTSKRESKHKSRRSTDDNDEDDSTSDSSDSSDSSSKSSNSSLNSSKKSDSSSSPAKRKRHYHGSSTSGKKSSRDHKKSREKDYRDRHYNHKSSSRHRYHSSDSDDYDDEDDYKSSKKYRSSRSTHHRERYRDRKSHTRTRSRSKSRSRSRSTYSSSRRRH